MRAYYCEAGLTLPRAGKKRGFFIWTDRSRKSLTKAINDITISNPAVQYDVISNLLKNWWKQWTILPLKSM